MAVEILKNTKDQVIAKIVDGGTLALTDTDTADFITDELIINGIVTSGSGAHAITRGSTDVLKMNGNNNWTRASGVTIVIKEESDQDIVVVGTGTVILMLSKVYTPV